MDGGFSGSKLVDAHKSLPKPSAPTHPPTADDWMKAGYLYHDRRDWRRVQQCWRECWDVLREQLPKTLQAPEHAEQDGAYNGFEPLINWLQDVQRFLDDHAPRRLDVARDSLRFSEEVLARFSEMDDLTTRNFQVSRSFTLARPGRQPEALSMLEQMIHRWPETAQGYAALARMLTWDARPLNIQPDPTRARQLLRSALDHAQDGPDFDIQAMLNDL